MGAKAAFVLLFAAAVLNVQGQSAIRTLDHGAHSNVDDPLTASARTDAEWSALWKRHNFDKPAPAVDFSKEMVVAVFMGSRPTGGFSLDITSAAESGGRFVVSYRERAPKPDALTAQVLTAPYHIAAVPKSALPIIFEKQ